MSISEDFTDQSAYPNQITTTGAEIGGTCNDGTGAFHRANVLAGGVIDGAVELASSVGYLVDGVNNFPMIWGAGKMQQNPWGGFDHINSTISEGVYSHICIPKQIDDLDEAIHMMGGGVSYIAPAGAVAKLMSVKALAKTAGFVGLAEGSAFASDLVGTIFFPEQVLQKTPEQNAVQNIQPLEFNYGPNS